MCVWPIEGPLGDPKIEHTFLATVLPIENLPLARVLIRVRNRPLQERHRNRPRSKTNESLACGLSKNAGLRCPLWVKSRHMQCKRACPLYTRKRTGASHWAMSAKGQKRTHAAYSRPTVR